MLRNSKLNTSYSNSKSPKPNRSISPNTKDKAGGKKRILMSGERAVANDNLYNYNQTHNISSSA
jgi:hypothetical protein